MFDQEPEFPRFPRFHRLSLPAVIVGIRRLCVLVLLLLAMLLVPMSLTWAPRARAQCIGQTTQLVAFAFESVTVSTISIGGTSATYKPSGQVGASVAKVQVESNPIRWRVDGGAPTAAIGHAAVDTQVLTLCGAGDIANFRAIRSGGSDAILRVTYFRPR